MLVIMTGLPGVGKTTLSKRLAYHLKATYIRIDTIEQSMKDAKIAVTYDESYRIAFNVATDNLLLGLMVVADSTNPVIESREAWWRVATRAKVKYLDIQVICSDKKEHRHRVESRKSDIPSLELPTWQSVIEREYDEWNTPESPSQLLTIDTAGLTEQQTFDNLLAEIRKANIIAHA